MLDSYLISVDDLEDLLDTQNGSSLDYQLFKKTDQVDSFLRQVEILSVQTELHTRFPQF